MVFQMESKDGCNLETKIYQFTIFRNNFAVDVQIGIMSRASCNRCVSQSSKTSVAKRLSIANRKVSFVASSFFTLCWILNVMKGVIGK